MKTMSVKTTIVFAVLAVIAAVLFLTRYSNFEGRDLRDTRTENYLSRLAESTKTEINRGQPNIILILTDDLGYGDLSSYGSTLIDTPNIDHLAENGMKMTNFYAPSSLCSPSRASILTGRYPQRTHVPAVLFDSGTVINTFRKYLGFYSFGMEGLSSDEVTISEALQSSGYSTAVIGKWHLGSQPGYLPEDNGFDYAYIPSSSEDKTKLTRKFTDEAVGFITQNKDKPFFLYYAELMPHEPLHRSEAFAGNTKAGMYGEVVQEVDWSVGVIVDKLVELGIDDNTLVIFSSDNGPYRMGSNGGTRGGKGLTTLGGQRVPFVAYWPGTIPPGQVSDEMVMGIDLFPTALTMAGIDLPDDRVIDGKNILPLLKGETRKTPHDYLFMMNDRVVESVLDKNGYKYQIASSPDTSKFWYLNVGPYLFNIDDDPSESYSILEMNPEKEKELSGKIITMQKTLETDLRGWR
jgi:arylsulfatase A